MNKITSLVLAGVCVWAGCATTPDKPTKQTYSSFDLPSEHDRADNTATGVLNFDKVPVDNVLTIYGAISKRTVLHGSLPYVLISVKTVQPLTKIEVLQLLDTALAQYGIAMVYIRDKTVRAVPADQAFLQAPPAITLPWQQLPESGSIMTRTVKVEHFKPTQIVPALMPFSRLPNSVLAIDAEHVLVLRDYSANIRQELKLLETLEAQKAPVSPRQ